MLRKISSICISRERSMEDAGELVTPCPQRSCSPPMAASCQPVWRQIPGIWTLFLPVPLWVQRSQVLPFDGTSTFKNSFWESVSSGGFNLFLFLWIYFSHITSCFVVDRFYLFLSSPFPLSACLLKLVRPCLISTPAVTAVRVYLERFHTCSELLISG